MTAAVPQIIGRYALHEEIASGGMARVHLARLMGPAGFSRTVAVKRLHSHVAHDPDFATMFLDEARIAARIRHPNVVATLDVVATGDELFLVMEYVAGESLARLEKQAFRRGPIPPAIASAILCGVLRGVHAAHEAKDERGEPLNIVHRDLTPHNILVGSDGIAYVVDFGVAKAAGKSHATRTGEVKGKVPYMSPEQIRGAVTRRTDVYAAAVVLWEALAGKRLFKGDNEVAIMAQVLDAKVAPPSAEVGPLPAGLDELVMRGLSRDPEQRFATADEMAEALERCVPPAPAREVGAWVESLASEVLAARAELVSRIESSAPREPGLDPLSLLGPSSQSGQAPASRPGLERSGATAPAVDVPVEGASRSGALSQGTGVKRSGGRWLPVVGIGAAMAAVLALGIALGRRSSDSGASGGSGASGAEAAPSNGVTTASNAVATASNAVPGAASNAVAAPGNATALPTGAATTSSSAVPVKAPAVKGTAQPKSPAKGSCNPPYVVDSNGVKHYKVDCL